MRSFQGIKSHTYPLHPGCWLDQDLHLSSRVLHRVGAALTPLRSTEEEARRGQGSEPEGVARLDRCAHLLKAEECLVFLMKAEMFLILLLMGSSFSESDRTPWRKTRPL